MLEGIDYSDARPGGAVIAAAGKRFAVRYLYPPVAGGKGLTAAEVQDLQAHGIAVVCVYEGAAGDMRKGYGQGAADARLAQTQLAGLPLSHSLPVYFAKDYDGGLTAAEIAYLAGATSVLGAARVGLYGGWQAIDDAITGKHAAWYWQTYAWSSGRVRAGIHLLQYSNGQWNGQVDYCRAMQAEYGQHAPAPVRPPVSAAPKKPGPTLYTLARGIPNPAFWRRFAWWAGIRTNLPTAPTVALWKAIQARLHREFGYQGLIDGKPYTLTYQAMQRLAKKGGYTGPDDGAPGTYTWRGVARYLNGQ